MKILIIDRKLEIQFEWLEIIWGFRKSITIPLKEIKSISLEKADWVWGLRAPGTSIPMYFHAGTFYTKHGREFWYYRLNKQPLIIEMKGKKPFKRVILGLDNNAELKNKIQRAMRNL